MKITYKITVSLECHSGKQEKTFETAMARYAAKYGGYVEDMRRYRKIKKNRIVNHETNR